MQLKLEGLRNLRVYNSLPEQEVQIKGEVELQTLYCAVCRTDAKMWKEGHRDLKLPRVMGHEIVAHKNGERFVVWPGISCGSCKFCLRGDENLCKEMRIIGFHHDGGFASTISVPDSTLIPVPHNLTSLRASFAEPAGCVVNAFKKLKLQKHERILIYGAGTLGLLIALMAKKLGANPLLLENNEIKKQKASDFVAKTGIQIEKETNQSNFDCVINACAQPLALFQGITKLDKGGRLLFFSGLNKNKQLESNLLNLVHYKELTLLGSYGLTKHDMEKGLHFLSELDDELDLLVEKVIQPNELEASFPEVLEGKPYKYIVEFSSNVKVESNNKKETNIMNTTNKPISTNQKIISTASAIQKQSKELKAAAQHKIDFKTKPLGALGKLEGLGVKMCLVQNTLNPVIKNKAAFVFAADHGIAEEGVSAFPQEVTQQMVQNFLDDGAAINVLCKHNYIKMSIVDMGVKGKRNTNSTLLNRRIAEGTKNFALEPAMTLAEAEQTICAGISVFEDGAKSGCPDIVGLGEMGIANTTSAAAIISVITGKSVKEVTWRGTGVDNQGLEHKVEVLEKALALHTPDPNNAIDVLMKVGGFEIGAMAGAALAAAANGCAVVLDGLISTAAGLLAYTINPDIANYFVAGHKSVEIGHVAALKRMDLEPILDLDMRLGEGTGAALTIGLVEASCKIMCDMASFEEAGVTNKED